MTPELEQYIASHISPEPENLRKIDRLTNLRLVNGRMCSGHIQGRLLKMLTAMIRPARVLELGTFSGYSALCMAEALGDDAAVDTIEAFDELEDFIRENLASSPAGKKVTLHIGNALEVMRQWKEPTFDLIFLDADKREYPAYLEACRPILRPGGFIIADNTLWDGHVLEENPSSAQTRAIKTFNDLAASDPDFETAIIPIRDGLTILRRK
ncbi:MAG: O-methyltransferase [Muribaculaceae bacterium]|nr:O-methyltransferase [Muribaculaceae bacterium]